MHNKNNIIAVSAGLMNPKKSYNKLNLMNRYLNYGLLGLVTELHNKGYNVTLYQGDYKNPKDFIKELEESESNLNCLSYPLILSLASNLSIPWAKEFCRLIKSSYPNLKIAAGGRWVIGENSDWIKSLIPEIDLAIPGFGEDIIEDILNESKWNSLKYNLRKPKETFKLFNYTLLNDYEVYNPCIEVSRGCGRGCNFCLEQDIPLIKLKQPSDIINEMKEYSKVYKDDDLKIYFESSLFAPTKKWSEELAKLYEKEGLKIKWRCTSRVDTFTPEHIKILAKAGLKVIDFGLESGSHTQLLRMGKTRNPDEYLRKSDALLAACAESGVWVKLNILLYPGENQKTYEETKKWLLERKHLIKGISVNPMTLYGQEADKHAFKQYGAEVIDTQLAYKRGYSNLNLSDEINYEKSIELSIELSKLIMSHSDYYDLKHFGYFPRAYTYKNFITDIKEIDPKTLPFTTPWERYTISNNTVVIFGGMGTGKSTLTEFLKELLEQHNYQVHCHNIGDTCRFFMKISDINPYWQKNTRSLSQQIASKLREVDINLLNDIIMADIQKIRKNSNFSDNRVINIVTGGRTLDDFKYWSSKNCFIIGVVSDKEKVSEWLNNRDTNQIQNEKNLTHETEKDTEYISRNLCHELVINNGSLLELKEKTSRIVNKYYKYE